MFRPVARAFGTFIPGGSGRFNITNAFQRLKNTIRAPVKHIKRNLEPTAADYNPMTNTTEEAFDEVSQEWQALIVGNPYDTNTMNMLEQSMIANFGTVDNPLVIFTSDAPFRYVGCSGQANEDDYEGHEFLIFMLREGPLQRCPSCGQVFKLVRLRNEFSPEMDYYMSNIIPYMMDEMGEMDQVINMSILRMQKDTYEYSQFETPSRTVYNLVNPDEHDRLLTDPAYRLERSKKLEEKLYVYLYSLKEIEKEYVESHGPIPRYPLNKVDYETLIDVEKSILRLDRLFRKVDKFNHRKYIDRENHARREKRMKERVADRWESNYSLFYGGRTEEEQRYRDYFETDLENEPEDEEIEQRLDENQVFANGDYNLDKYDFQELYTRAPEDDATSFMEKKAFKFKYRMAHDSSENYERRNQRLIDRHLQRFQDKSISELVENLTNAISENNAGARALYEREYLEVVSKEAIHQYQDYFESDPEEDFTVFDTVAEDDKITFLNVYENYATPDLENAGVEKVPKRAWDVSAGLWTNFYYSFKGYTGLVFPKAKELANLSEKSQVDVLAHDDLEKIGLYNTNLTGIDQETTRRVQKEEEAPRVEENLGNELKNRK